MLTRTTPFLRFFRVAVGILWSLILMTGSVRADYTGDEPLTVAAINGVDIAYKSVGPDDSPAVLMVMGLTGSHRLWGQDIVQGLLDNGYRVILFDNRDTGDSARLDALGTPVLWWEMLKNALGFEVNAPYSLRDMAQDAIGLMDVLNLSHAHVVGASMGGMIAQIIAAEHPQRTQSLVSIMSTTGAPHLPQPEEQAADGLLGIADTEGDASSELNEMGIYPEAMPRQLMAIVAAGDRSAQVQTIAVPTLVLHGAEDTLLPPPHGEHTHALIDGSTYVVYPDMGHNLPAAVVPEVVDAMHELFSGVQGD